jgi:hypothetical protein
MASSAARERGLDHTSQPAGSWDGGGPLGDPDPLVVSLFEAANDRRATPLERTLLAELERDADPAARAAGADGATWVAAALREAVAAGSSFVAPKRIREIIARWAVAGMPEPTPLGTPAFERRRTERHEPENPTSAIATSPSGDPATAAADVRLPGGHSGHAVWSSVLSELRRTLDPAAFDRLLSGSSIVRYWRGSAEIAVASDAAAEKLSHEYRSLIERQINAHLRRSVAVSFVVQPVAEDPSSTRQATYPADIQNVAVASDDDSTNTLAVARADLDLGRQVWRAALDDLQTALAADDLDALSSGAVLGEDVDGNLLIAALSPRAQRLVSGRHRAAVESSLATLLGRPVTLRCLAAKDWRLE